MDGRQQAEVVSLVRKVAVEQRRDLFAVLSEVIIGHPPNCVESDVRIVVFQSKAQQLVAFIGIVPAKPLQPHQPRIC